MTPITRKESDGNTSNIASRLGADNVLEGVREKPSHILVRELIEGHTESNSTRGTIIRAVIADRVTPPAKGEDENQ